MPVTPASSDSRITGDALEFHEEQLRYFRT
jgi:hypothetical protein